MLYSNLLALNRLLVLSSNARLISRPNALKLCVTGKLHLQYSQRYNVAKINW